MAIKLIECPQEECNWPWLIAHMDFIDVWNINPYIMLSFLSLSSLTVFLLCLQDSSSSESLDGRSLDSAKSFDAVVFDMLKVTPEEFAVSL